MEGLKHQCPEIFLDKCWSTIPLQGKLDSMTVHKLPTGSYWQISNLSVHTCDTFLLPRQLPYTWNGARHLSGNSVTAYQEVVHTTASSLWRNLSCVFIRQLPDYCMMVRRCLVTPTRIVRLPPETELSNRILRRYKQYADRFLRVSFAEENAGIMHLSGRASTVADLIAR